LCCCRSFTRRGDLEDRDNAVDASNTPLLRGFMHSLVKEGSTDSEFTAMEVSKCNSKDLELCSGSFSWIL